MTKIYDLDSQTLIQKYHDLQAMDKKVRSIMTDLDDDVNAPFPSLSDRVYTLMSMMETEVGSRNL